MTAASPEPAARIGLRALQQELIAALREDREILDLPAGHSLLADPPRGTAGERWRIYREGYFTRLAESLQNDYPAVARVLGASAFGALCRRYILTNPPSSHDIGRAGDLLPAFLGGDPLLARLPFLVDLAEFELALSRALVAEDPDPSAREVISSVGADGLTVLPLELAPGAAVIRSKWPIAEIWALKDIPDEGVSLDVEGRPANLAVHRHGLEVRWRSISMEDATFLESLASGASLAFLAESGRFGEPEEAVPLLVSWFRSGVESSILRLKTNVAPACAHQ